jgi:3-hydroxybutyrate dehydrogenase
MTLKAKNAVITGSTSGIGLAIAKSLAAEGVNVMLNGLGTHEEMAPVLKEIEALGVKAMFSPANMMKPQEIAGMVADAEKAFGSVDILVNNAGVQFVSPIEDFPEEKWHQIIAIDLSAVFFGVKAALPGMKARKWGRIINTASAHALVASPFKSAYVAAKHGVLGLTKVIALEGATFGVTANAICPGYVWTPLVEKQIPDTMKARGLSREQVIDDVLLAAQPSKQFVTVEQVAGTVLFLCSDAAAQITGTHIDIDGGWTAH